MQTTAVWNKSVSIILINSLVALMLASCAHKNEDISYEAISPLDNIQNNLERGDTVRTMTKDGRDLIFKITVVTSEAIAGQGLRVRFSEIAKLEKQKISGRKIDVPLTVANVVGGVLGIWLGIWKVTGKLIFP